MTTALETAVSTPSVDRSTDQALRPLRDTKAIVLAGTYAWGRSAFETLAPRPVMPVLDRPLISWVLDWLAGAGIEEVTVCANSSTRAVQRAMTDRATAQLSLTYYEDHIPRGAAGCARDAARDVSARNFVIADAAAIPTFELYDVVRQHQETLADLTVVVEPAPDADEQRPDAPVGIYVCSPAVFEMVPAAGFHDIKENLIPRLYRAGRKVLTYRLHSRTPRVLDGTSYLGVCQWAIQRAVPSTRRLADYSPSPLAADCLVHSTAHVANGALLVGPVVLGPSVRVNPGAVIVGPTSIGAGSEIEEGAVVSRSILWSGTTVGESAFVDQSILGDGAHIHPRAQVVSQVRGARIAHPQHEAAPSTPIRRLGAALSLPLNWPAFGRRA